jgi:peroxiredoxin Q/BCP
VFWTTKAGPRPGDAAPTFSLPDADGTVFELASQRSRKRVVLAFYPQDDTPG